MGRYGKARKHQGLAPRRAKGTTRAGLTRDDTSVALPATSPSAKGSVSV